MQSSAAARPVAGGAAHRCSLRATQEWRSIRVLRTLAPRFNVTVVSSMSVCPTTLFDTLWNRNGAGAGANDSAPGGEAHFPAKVDRAAVRELRTPFALFPGCSPDWNAAEVRAAAQTCSLSLQRLRAQHNRHTAATLTSSRVVANDVGNEFGLTCQQELPKPLWMP